MVSDRVALLLRGAEAAWIDDTRQPLGDRPIEPIASSPSATIDQGVAHMDACLSVERSASVCSAQLVFALFDEI